MPAKRRLGGVDDLVGLRGCRSFVEQVEPPAWTEKAADDQHSASGFTQNRLTLMAKILSKFRSSPARSVSSAC